MIKVGIYSPYLEMMGGGERYILSIAETLSEHYQVDLYFDQNIKNKSAEFLDIALKRVHFVPSDTLRKQNLFKRYNFLRQYNLFFYVTDGSLFFSGAKKNFLIVQSPLHIPNSNLFNQLKLYNWKIVCYSQFMKDIISQKLGESFKVLILPPCVNVPGKKINLEDKENIIITVGRFFPYPHDKKQKVLAEFFKTSYKKYFPGWKFIIAGGLTEEGGRKMLEELKDSVSGFPVEIKINLKSSELIGLYQKAKIYWHAAGFGEDLTAYPQKAEHFGIVPIEAMSYGTVPVVFNGGGLKDIISEGIGGYLWDSKEELISKTSRLVTDTALWKRQAHKAKEQALDYSCDKFYEKIERVVSQ